MIPQQFTATLQELKARFDAMQPEFEATLRVPGASVEGYVVVWNTGISCGGPLERCGKGGTRITPTVSLDEVKMLARRMALKNAAVGLPLGGAKSGIKADPDSAGFEGKYRSFARACRPLLFENGGIFGGFGFDIGGRPVHPRWICEELDSLRCFTGKPADMGGTDYDREGIAGLGVAIAARTALEVDGRSAAQARFSVQGAGAMGSAVVRYFGEYGGILDSIADPRLGGTWVFPGEGPPLDLIDALGTGRLDDAQKLLHGGGFTQLPDLDAVLFRHVDVVFPCAVHEVVHSDNAARIIAPYLVEGANGPCTKEAQVAMHRQGTIVIPDFIANSGGIIAAYVEMTAAAASTVEAHGNTAHAKSTTEERIRENTQALMRLVRTWGMAPMDAGMYMALCKIFNIPQDLNFSRATRRVV